MEVGLRDHTPLQNLAQSVSLGRAKLLLMRKPAFNFFCDHGLKENRKQLKVLTFLLTWCLCSGAHPYLLPLKSNKYSVNCTEQSKLAQDVVGKSLPLKVEYCI